MQRIALNNRGLALLAGLLGLGAPLWGAPAYLKIDDVRCEAVHPRYVDWCEVSSFAFGGASATDVVSGAGSGGAPTIGDISIVKPIDLGTTAIFQAFAQGRHIRDITLSFVKTVNRSDFEYLKIELSDCIVTKVNYGFADEAVSISWVRIRMTYRPVRVDGAIGQIAVVTWDRRLNRSF